MIAAENIKVHKIKISSGDKEKRADKQTYYHR